MPRPRILRDRAHARLLAAARAGDSEAFRRLYRETLPPVSRYLETRLERREDAEELTARVFHRFVERLDSFDPQRGSVMAWLLTMAHHALVDHYRTARPTLPVEQLAETLAGAGPSALDGVLREEREARLRQLVRELPAEMRRMFSLRFEHGLRYRDIAACMELSEAAVKQRFSRGLRQLRVRWREGASDLAPRGRER